MTETALRQVIVTNITPNGEGNISIRLSAKEGDFLAEYSPGAHIDLMIPGVGPRQYSLCGIDNTSGYEICIKCEPNGRGGSLYLHKSIRIGDTVEISHPKNHFKIPKNGKILFFAGGIGITPILVMAEYHVLKGYPVELHYYSKNQNTVAFSSRTALLAAQASFYLHLSEHQGSLRENIPVCLQKPEKNTYVVACGSEGFIQRVKSIMHDNDWSEEQFFFEKFSTKNISITGDSEFSVTLNSTGEEFFIPANKTIAEVLLSSNVDIMVSCEQGICGSCITDVISGIPDHRDSVLTAEEHAENTQITLCCSRAKSPKLVLDL